MKKQRTLPYENATSGTKALDEIQRVLSGFGCARFGHMTDVERGEVLVQFEFRGTPVSVRASIGGYAAAWLKAHPFNNWTRVSRVAYERKAKDVAAIAVYSILRDWIKGQITAVETGILSFEGAFLGQILLPSGRTVLEQAREQKMLPAPSEEKVVPISR